MAGTGAISAGRSDMAAPPRRSPNSEANAKPATSPTVSVRDPAPLLRDPRAAISIGLERHGGSRVIGGVVLLRQPSPHTNRPIRATNSPQVAPGFTAAIGQILLLDLVL